MSPSPHAGETTPATAGKPDPILPHHRVALVGMTGTGKSQLGLGLLADEPGQRILIDVNDHYYLGPDVLEDEHGWQEVEDAREIDWRNRTIRAVPPRFGKASVPWFNDLYAAIWEHGDVTVLLDESVGPTSEHYAPEYLLIVATQGRKRRIRHIAAMQAPVGIAPVLLTQAEHGFVFDIGARRDYLNAVGERFGWNGAEVGEAIRELHDEYGYVDSEGAFRCHGYLRHRLGRREVYSFPPLLPAMIARTERHFINPG